MSWRSICIPGSQIAAKRLKKHKKISCEDGIAAKERKKIAQKRGQGKNLTQGGRFLTEGNEGNEGGFSALFSGADDLLRRS
jgi:hypothetical protein